MSVITGMCSNCGKALPPSRGNGRPRKYCSPACRYFARDARRAADSFGFRTAAKSIANPHDPRTHDRRTVECVVRLLAGERDNRLPEDVVAQALIEARQLAWAFRRAGAECPPALRARAYELAAAWERALDQHFEGII